MRLHSRMLIDTRLLFAFALFIPTYSSLLSTAKTKVAYDEPSASDDPVVLTWKSVKTRDGTETNQGFQASNRHTSSSPNLNVFESLLNFKNVNIQVGNVLDAPMRNSSRSRTPSAQRTPKKWVLSRNVNANSPMKRIWPSASGQSDEFTLESIENALRLKAMAVGTEELLYKTLLDSRYYEKDVRPTHHHNSPTNVTFGFLLNQLVEMDERNQKLTTRSWMNVNWLDKRLSWNFTNWDGIKQIYIPQDKIWKPDILLINNAAREYSLLSTDVMVTYEGNVTWLYSALFKSNCAIRVRDYPFDSQSCDLNFASWSHDIRELDVMINTEKGDLSSYMNNSEFDLVDMTARRIVSRFPTDNATLWPMIVIRIRMNRRPLFYAFNHILPCILITSMALLGFFMPPETGEKINMLTTVLITVSTVSESITQSIPPSSEAIPLIGQYYLASLFIVCAATATNVVILKIHRAGAANQGRSVPYWLEKIVLGYLASLLCITIHEPDSITLLKASQSRLSTLRRSSLMRDLKKSKNLEYRKGRKIESICECLNASPTQIRHQAASEYEIDLLKEPIPKSTSETAFLNKLVKEQIIPRIQKSNNRPAMLAEFEERFKRILKRIYRSLQQNEIREEILDERRRIQWQWRNLANVLDRFLLVIFLGATVFIVSIFMLPQDELD